MRSLTALAVCGSVGLTAATASGAAAAPDLSPADLGITAPAQADRVQQLLDEWGAECPRYDLSGDGRVGIEDLLEMLSRMEHDGGYDTGSSTTTAIDETTPRFVGFEGAAEPAPTLHTIFSPEGYGVCIIVQPEDLDGFVAPENDVMGLLLEWGSVCPSNDLDGDGVVGMGDLLQLLASFGFDSSTPPVQIGESIIDQLIDEWGAECPDADIDGDGYVGINDLLAALAAMGSVLTVQDVQPIEVIEGWGEVCPGFDMNGDGHVGIEDLLALLAAIG